MAASATQQHNALQLANDPAALVEKMQSTLHDFHNAPDPAAAVARYLYPYSSINKALMVTFSRRTFETAPGLLEATCELLVFAFQALTTAAAAVGAPQQRQQRRQRWRLSSGEEQALSTAVELMQRPLIAMVEGRDGRYAGATAARIARSGERRAMHAGWSL
jgi:predicted house-cleaning NTP pyrophosphatase (Maf/HAM1 superfamily)